MTVQSRSTLKATFEDGDTPAGSDYTDLMDSFVHISDTSAQSVGSPLVITTMGATTVSAANMEVTNLTLVAEVTSAVSAEASANRFIKVISSGASYWIPAYTDN